MLPHGAGQSSRARDRRRPELFLRVADKAGVDLDTAVRRKSARNEEKCPPEKARGNERKYDRL